MVRPWRIPARVQVGGRVIVGVGVECRSLENRLCGTGVLFASPILAYVVIVVVIVALEDCQTPLTEKVTSHTCGLIIYIALNTSSLNTTGHLNSYGENTAITSILAHVTPHAQYLRSLTNRRRRMGRGSLPVPKRQSPRPQALASSSA
jgi:hypothetical protein